MFMISYAALFDRLPDRIWLGLVSTEKETEATEHAQDPNLSRAGLAKSLVYGTAPIEF